MNTNFDTKACDLLTKHTARYVTVMFVILTLGISRANEVNALSAHRTTNAIFGPIAIGDVAAQQNTLQIIDPSPFYLIHFNAILALSVLLLWPPPFRYQYPDCTNHKI